MSNAKGINKKGSSQTKSKDNNNSKIYQFKPTKRTLADNVYYLGSAKQASDYESITEFLINYQEDIHVWNGHRNSSGELARTGFK